MLVRKTAGGGVVRRLLRKAAEQLGFFGGALPRTTARSASAHREDPRRPGSRGGRWYRTDGGRVRYGLTLGGKHQPLPLGPAPQLTLDDFRHRVKEEATIARLASKPDPRKAAKLRRVADALDEVIASKRDPAIAYQNVTARRSGIVARLEGDARHLERVQSVLRELADMSEQGTVPYPLRNVATRTDVENLLTTRFPGGMSLSSHQLASMLEDLDTTVTDLSQVATEHTYRFRGWRPLDLAGVEDGVPALRAVVARAEALRERVECHGCKGAGGDCERCGGKGHYPGERPHSIAVTLDEWEKIGALARRIASQKPLNKYGHVQRYDAQRVAEAVRDGGRAVRLGLDSQEQWDEAKAAAQALARDSGNPVTDQIRAAERSLVGMKIPGYFPTPTATVDRMLELADINRGHRVLEPSAGKGNIADRIRERHQNDEIDLATIELSGTLRPILEMKGHKLVGRDFLEHRELYDRIVMNPPFEGGADIDHLRHAYSLLKPGGRVVSIMCEGPFFREDGKSKEFRTWLDSDVQGTHEKLPAGSFLSSERPTGVNTRLVVISKPFQSARSSLQAYLIKRGANARDRQLLDQHFDEIEAGRAYGLGADEDGQSLRLGAIATNALAEWWDAGGGEMVATERAVAGGATAEDLARVRRGGRGWWADSIGGGQGMGPYLARKDAIEQSVRHRLHREWVEAGMPLDHEYNRRLRTTPAPRPLYKGADVRSPGIRGGRFRITPSGRVSYRIPKLTAHAGTSAYWQMRQQGLVERYRSLVEQLAQQGTADQREYANAWLEADRQSRAWLDRHREYFREEMRRGGEGALVAAVKHVLDEEGPPFAKAFLELTQARPPIRLALRRRAA